MSWRWNAPPGTPVSRRKTARKVVVSFLVGVLCLGVAWAGNGLVPVGDLIEEGQSSGAGFIGLEQGGAGEDAGSDSAAALEPLKPGQIYAGAAKVSLLPRPDDYKADFPGAEWQRDHCTTAPSETPDEENYQEYPGYAQGVVENNIHNETHVSDFRVRWNEHSNCIYMGGYGLGPMFPITKWDDNADPAWEGAPSEHGNYGLWTRSIAMSDGSETVVLTLIDAVYWEAHYNNMCDGCGFIDLTKQLAEETGLPENSFIFASTHSHTSPDFIGGWGGVPPWYMQQATDSLKASATTALASMQPAVLEAGEEIVRARNAERRDFYRSAEDDNMSWFRLIDADSERPEVCTTPAPSPSPTRTKGPKKKPSPTPSPAPSPVCEPGSPGQAIATVGAFAAHPVTADESSGIGDADFPAVFAKNVEERFGGVGMFLQTGLGNVSPRGSKVEMGDGLAGLVPPLKAGSQITEPDLRVGRTFWDQPATNSALSALGAAGFFDRPFNQSPATVSAGKGGEENKKCRSASPTSVRTSVSAVKIGSLWITGGPGEIFSNLSNTIEERNPNGVTLALGLVNDGLGYIVQSFETDHVGRQAVGFVGKAGPVGLSEYEDAYSIDHCFGDATLEHTLGLLGTL